jgi:hypothetical protein
MNLVGSDLETTLSYALNTQKTATVNVSYIDGRNQGTLEKEKSWKIGLGLKY